MIEVGRQTEVSITAALVGGQHQLTQLNLEPYQAKAWCLVALRICRTKEKHIILAVALLTLDALDERWQLFEVGWITIDERCTAIVSPVNANTTGELSLHTRHELKYRRRPKHKRFPITERTSIHSRPKQAGGKRFGDFEVDLIADGHNHIILTIVERSTNMLFKTKLAHKKKAEPLVKAVKRLLLPTRNTSRP